jgi:MazG family protein
LSQSFNDIDGGRVTAGGELEKLLALMARLRAPDGCPWDREQTFSSLRPFILEEAYELVEALSDDAGSDSSRVREELGDLLLEIVFVNQIAEEQHAFRMEEVIRGIHDKLVRRHPHVFESDKAANAGEAIARWEDIKAKEKAVDGVRSSLLDGVPKVLPALARAQKVSARAARAGFDWSSATEVKQKLDEELKELEAAVSSGEPAAVAEEMGDILFALVNLARHLEVDAELALVSATAKFGERFRFIESELAREGRRVEDATMDELEELWNQAKKRPVE